MIDLCCEYLSVLCIRLYDIIMSRMSFRVNPHSIVEMHRTDKYLQIHHTNARTNSYSQHSSIILRVWLNGWMFVYKLSGCGFDLQIPLLSLKEQCLYLNTDFNTDVQAKITKWPVINVFDFLVLGGYKMRTLARYGLIQVLERPFLWMILKQSIVIEATKIIKKGLADCASFS